MRLAVSGSHGVGKSTLIAAFLKQRREYGHEPEAFEVLGDDVDVTESGVPTPDALHQLLEYTVSALEARSEEERVVFDRGPADYLAYAAARGKEWLAGEKDAFLAAHIPIVRSAMGLLGLVAYVPLSDAGPSRRRGEDERFRRRVDRWLRRILLDDAYELFGGAGAPRVCALPATPKLQLAELVRQIQWSAAPESG
jgi:hypothetical protein